MRCQCIICQELFENKEDEVISALDCGHTFHNVCLNQWLENGSTCPSCRKAVNRKKIINRLFFDAPDDGESEVDSVQLENELDRLKLELRRKEKDKNDALREKDEIFDRLTHVEKAKKQVERDFKKEQSTSSAQLKTLRYYVSQEKSLEAERQEIRKIKQKLATLQTCETLLNGCEGEAAEIISNTGEGPGAVQSLSRQVAFMKREYEKLKLEKKQAKDHYEKVQLRDMQKTKTVSDLKEENKKLRDQLERSEGDLTIAEREIDFLKKSNNKLKKVFKSPGAVDTKSASFTQILNESDHVNMFTSSTPKLGRCANSELIDLDETPDLFASPELSSKTANSSSKQNCDSNPSQMLKKSLKRPLESSENVENEGGMTMKYLKTSSVAEKHSQGLKKQKSESSVTDVNSITAIAGMNIFKKRTLGEPLSVTRKGYDGFGGHTTFVNAQGGSKNIFKKPAVKRNPFKPAAKLGTKGTLTSLGFSVLGGSLK